MKRRQQLVLALAGAAAAAAGLSWALWRPTAETGSSDDFWALRFPRPEGGELAMADYRHQLDGPAAMARRPVHPTVTVAF